MVGETGRWGTCCEGLDSAQNRKKSETFFCMGPCRYTVLNEGRNDVHLFLRESRVAEKVVR